MSVNSASYSGSPPPSFTGSPPPAFTGSTYEFWTPPPAKWKVGTRGSTYWCFQYDAPNGFQRLMQRLVLGIVWERL